MADQTRGRLIACSLAVVALACTPSLPREGDETPTSRTPKSPSASPVQLSGMRLFADNEDRPVQWDTVVSANYGPDIAELGAIVARKQGAPIFPVSFAIDNDGSVWILDAVKHRI